MIFPDNELAKPEKCLQNIKRLKIGKENQRKRTGILRRLSPQQNRVKTS